MKKNFSASQSQLSNFLKILIALALITGIFCRFYNIDQKALSNDETFSSTYIYGQNLAQIIDTQIVTADQLQSYQRFNPQESLTDSVHRLIKQPYVFPPLYGILMQLWARFWSNFTDSPAIISRSLSIFISLFSLLGMYWLYRELSGLTTMAWIATAFVAISPFHLQYAQIVRTYSLTAALTLLSSAALLRAIRVKTRFSWIIYAISVSIGLYSNLLFGFVAIAHAIYVFWLEKFRFTQIFRSYFLAALAGGSTFIPWFILFISSPGLLGYSVAQVLSKTSPFALIKIWLKNIRTIFIDVNNPWIEFTNIFSGVHKILSPLLVLLFFISIYYLCRYTPRAIRLFILCLIIFGGGLLMIKDLIMGGTFSARLRYLIPYVIGVELAVICLLTNQLMSKTFWQKKLAEITIASLLIGGIISCGLIAQSNSWVAFGSPEFPLVASEINKTENPVIIFEDFGDALCMSYLLKPQVHAHLTRQVDFHLGQNQSQIYENFSDIFLFKPSKSLQKKLKNNSNLDMQLLWDSPPSIPIIPKVWKIKID